MNRETPPRDDRELARRLRELEPPADFPAAELEARIAASVAETEPSRSASTADRGHAEPSPTPRPASGRWPLRLAAALAFFALGLATGRLTSDAPTAGDLTVAYQDDVRSQVDGAPLPAQVAPERLAYSIQSAGTGYVSSLAQLSEMSAQLSPDERRQAREVAVSVLAGAIAELMLEWDESEPGDLLRRLESLDSAGTQSF